MDGTVTVNDPQGLSDPAAVVSGERSMPPVSLRSVQPYRTQDEYIIVMKEDLAEWLNELYNTTITADDLFDKLDNGILLCRYACIVDDAIKSRDIRSEPIVYRERGVEAGSFQARVNVAAFLAWCRRRPLQMPDDVLFETGDLICQRSAERNERQVALCLLEVGRRSAALQVGLPAPQLVRLEAEIDAEIRADDGGLSAITDCHTYDIDNDENEDSLSNAQQSSVAGTPRSAARKSGIRPPCVNVRNVHTVESPAVSTDTIQSEKRGSVWQRRRFRPVIPVDMMSLDEMVRQILGRCTCPNQYPMIRISEGKYRVGDNLTLIFVRILRQHVMVRIGGGWNTLENYLARCDPCRCQKNPLSQPVIPTTSTIITSAFSSDQSAIFNKNGGVSHHHQQVLDDDRFNSCCTSPPLPRSSLSEPTTVVTTSGKQQLITRRPSNLSLTSQVLSVGSPPTTTQQADAMIRDTNDVILDSASGEGCSSCCDNDCSVTSIYSTSTSHMTVMTLTSSSPSFVTAASSTPVHTSCSCSRLMGSGSDDKRRRSVDSRTSSCRPSRIPLPLRFVAQCPPHSASFFLGAAVNSPNNGHRHRRCDSGVDLNLSSPDFE